MGQRIDQLPDDTNITGQERVALQNMVGVTPGQTEDASLTDIQTWMVAAEAGARAAADVILQGNINGEASTRAGADSVLQSAIDAEASTRAGAASALQAAIDSETSTRSGADSALQASIDAEASTRGTAVSGLQSAIDSEASTRATDVSAVNARFSSRAVTITDAGGSADVPHAFGASYQAAVTLLAGGNVSSRVKMTPGTNTLKVLVQDSSGAPVNCSATNEVAHILFMKG